MRVWLQLSAVVAALWMTVGCVVDAPEPGEDTEDPGIIMTIGPLSVRHDREPPGEDFDCVTMADAPVAVTVLATDSGGMSELYVHLIDGDLVAGSPTATPAAPESEIVITEGDTVLTEGDDEISVLLSPPGEGKVRTGLTLQFEVEGPDRYAIQALATDVSGNQSIIWPTLVHVEPLHGPCPE